MTNDSLYGFVVFYPEYLPPPGMFVYLRVVKPWWARALHAIGINYGYYVVENP